MSDLLYYASSAAWIIGILCTAIYSLIHIEKIGTWVGLVLFSLVVGYLATLWATFTLTPRRTFDEFRGMESISELVSFSFGVGLAITSLLLSAAMTLYLWSV